MATVMSMHWPEVTKEQYEAVRREVNWEGDVPAGAKFHVAWFGDDGFHVVDLWDSPAAFEAFVRQRLTPGVQKVGIEGNPTFTMHDAQSVFAPNV
jgi:hypothetical protein